LSMGEKVPHRKKKKSQGFWEERRKLFIGKKQKPHWWIGRGKVPSRKGERTRKSTVCGVKNA